MGDNALNWRNISVESWAMMKEKAAISAFLLLLVFEFLLLGDPKVELLSSTLFALFAISSPFTEAQFPNTMMIAAIAVAGFLLSIVVRAAFVGRAIDAPLFGPGLRAGFRNGLKRTMAVIIAVLVITGLQFLALHGAGFAAAAQEAQPMTRPAIPELPEIETPPSLAGPVLPSSVSIVTSLGVHDTVQKFGKPVWPTSSVDFCLLGLTACAFGAAALLSPLLLVYFALAFFALFIIQEVLGGKGALRAIKGSFSLVYEKPIAALTLWALSLAFFVAISAVGWGLSLVALAVLGSSLASTVIYHAASVFALLFILAFQSRAWLRLRRVKRLGRAA